MKNTIKSYTEEHNLRHNSDLKLDVLRKQQQEFINYLEDETSKWHNNYDSYNYEYEIEEPTAEELVNEILQKYKEIVNGTERN